jgi:hypothetical protein
MNRATPALLVQGHKKTLPMLVFVTVIIATLGLVFVLENLRPEVRAVPSEAGRERDLLQKSA